jgi:hypothetical protein
MEKGQLRQKNYTRGTGEYHLDRRSDMAFGPISRPLRKAEAIQCMCMLEQWWANSIN